MKALAAKISALHRVMSQRSLLSGLFRRKSHGKWGPSRPFAEAIVCQLHSNQTRTSDSDNAISCDEPLCIITTNAIHLQKHRRQLHVPQFVDAMGSRWTGWDLF